MFSSRRISELVRGCEDKQIYWNFGFFTAQQLCNHLNFTSQKLTRFSQHRNYLNLAEEKKFVPKGMLKLSPLSFSGRQNGDLVRNIRIMDYNNSIRMMRFFKQWYPGQIDILRTRLFNIKKVLECNIPFKTVDRIWRVLQNQHDDMSRSIRIIHGKKSTRDVYFNRQFRYDFGISASVFGSFSDLSIGMNCGGVSQVHNPDAYQPASSADSYSTCTLCLSHLSTPEEIISPEDDEYSTDDNASYYTCVSTVVSNNDEIVAPVLTEDVSSNTDEAVCNVNNKSSLSESPSNAVKIGYQPVKYFPVQLCEDEMDIHLKEVCALGKSFVPSNPNLNRTQMEEGFRKWALSLRRSAYFQQKKFPSRDVSVKEGILKKLEGGLVRSVFEPPDSFRVPALEAYIDKVYTELFNPANHRRVFSNLSNEQREAIKRFKSDPDHIIRQQDKGGKFTFNSTAAYKEKIESTIKDPQTFETLASDPTQEYKQRIEAWSIKYRGTGDITDKIADWVIPEDAAPGAIYGLDKTHKSPPTLRTITSGCGTVTENLAAFVALILKPLVMKLPCIIMDTNGFLRLLEKTKDMGPLPPHTKLVTVDVINMFPSIDNDKGIKAARDHLDQRQHKVPSTHCVLEALQICLESNCSQFGNTFIKQHKGAATGPRYVCDYADLAMARHDQIITDFADEFMLSYCRYRDDCFFLWVGPDDTLTEYFGFMNTIDPKIQFTMNSSTTEIDYLDVRVYIKDGLLQTTVYSKPTDDHVYLHPSSNHPRHQMKAIPRGQAIRLKRIISEESKLNQAFAIYLKHFVDRGYDKTLVEKSFNDVRAMDRLELLQENNSNVVRKGRVYPLVIEHNPKLPSINQILRSNLSILHASDDMKALFPSESLFCAAKRGKNLKEILSPSRFKDKTENVPKGCVANYCGKNCNLCSYMVSTPTIRSFSTNEVFAINDLLHCNSKNVIYCINDVKCNLQNVGSSSDFKKRFRNYKAHIKSGNSGCNLYRHWNSPEVNHLSTHPVPTDQRQYDSLLRQELQVVLLEEVRSIRPSDSSEEVSRKLEVREGIWQVRLKTEVPFGLNAKGEFRFKH